MILRAKGRAVSYPKENSRAPGPRLLGGRGVGSGLEVVGLAATVVAPGGVGGWNVEGVPSAGREGPGSDLGDHCVVGDHARHRSEQTQRPPPVGQARRSVGTERRWGER